MANSLRPSPHPRRERELHGLVCDLTCLVQATCQKGRLLSGEPVSKPHLQVLHAFHTSGTCEEFGAEHTSIRSLVGQPMHGASRPLIVPALRSLFTTQIR